MIGSNSVLNLETDGLSVFANDTAGSDTYIRHEYLGHLASIGSHLIGVGYYEGGGFLLLNDSTGESTKLAAPNRPQLN